MNHKKKTLATQNQYKSPKTLLKKKPTKIKLLIYTKATKSNNQPKNNKNK